MAPAIKLALMPLWDILPSVRAIVRVKVELVAPAEALVVTPLLAREHPPLPVPAELVANHACTDAIARCSHIDESDRESQGGTHATCVSSCADAFAAHMRSSFAPGPSGTRGVCNCTHTDTIVQYSPIGASNCKSQGGTRGTWSACADAFAAHTRTNFAPGPSGTCGACNRTHSDTIM